MSAETIVKSKNSLAVASFILGILSIGVHILFGAAGSNCMGGLAVLTGILSLLQIQKGNGAGRAFAIAGILLGLVPFFITLFAILSLVPSSPTY